jgi:antitoxin (DNA-binding transcriptional repressor) of toxin-antitoxin stability system
MTKSSAAINIHEAKTHLSKLVDRAAKAEAFVIPKR